MPPLGQTTEEIKILKWFKSEGDRVELGDELLQVETDKADLAVESYHAGVLLRQLAEEGQVVSVGDLVAYVGEAGEEIPALGESGPQPQSAPAPASVPNSPVEVKPHLGHEPAPGGKVLASPAARQLGMLHEIDLTSIHGSGPGGRVEVEDVYRAVAGES
jgi:pyruvate dehydrogenase E2 component (dihydrolipoamide acetyltransferase)